MIALLRQTFGRAVESSVVVRWARRVTANSILLRAVVVAARSLRRTRDRIVTGVKIESPVAEQRRTTERLETVASSSRVVKTLSSVLNAPLVASREAALTSALHPLIALSLEKRVQIAAWVVVTAVLTNIILVAFLGVSVQMLGWSVRAGLVATGLVVAWRPSAIAAAWRDRVAETGNHDDA